MLDDDSLPDSCAIIKDTGGPETPWTLFNRQTIQIYNRGVDQVDVKKLAEDIYTLLHGKFGLVLPSVTVKTVTYDQIQTAQITGIQRPFCLGMDENGRVEYTTNYQVIYRR